MKTLLSLLLIVGFQSVYSQSFVPFYGSLADSCRQDSITSYLQQFESLGVKEAGTSQLQNAKNWLLGKYAALGYTDVVQDDFTVFGSTTLTNIVVTKTGTLYPNTYVIIDGHYDTKNGTGTNDNGTGTSIILELARILKDIPTEYSIKFIHFSGEEIGLTGSTHYVNNVVVANNYDIKVVINIDEVGGVAGMLNNTIVCERDESQPNSNDAQSAVYTQELANCVGLYSSLLTEISYAYASDYVPFMNSGYVVTGFYEQNETPHVHTATDSIAYVDIPYVYQITKATMGGLAHFAIPYDVSGLEELTTQGFTLYPNPANDLITIESDDFNTQSIVISIVDLAGNVVQKNSIESFVSGSQVEISALKSGLYFVQIEGKSTRSVSRLLKQ